jgi:hydrogenase/urease accessory protein HupE
MIRPGRLVCASLAVLAASAPLGAHEVGTSRVDVTFEKDRTYRIELVTDAASLLEKLEPAGIDDPSSIAPAEMASRLQALDAVFRRRIDVAFDGARAVPTITYEVDPPAAGSEAPTATVRLVGDVPPGAQHFRWSYAWTFTPYAFSVGHAAEARRDTRWREGGQPSQEISVTAPEPPPGWPRTAMRYLWLGFSHIVPKGLDHVLFVLGIFLLNRRMRPVLWQVSAFTVAHSITLGSSLYGVVSLPSAFVEPMIALSIVYVAAENLFVSELRGRRVALVFAFGLLHGLGFAGVLRDAGLPASDFATALVTFNLGVEAGQLAVIGAAFLLVGWGCGARPWYRQRIVVPLSLAIGCVALYWTIVRLPL